MSNLGARDMSCVGQFPRFGRETIVQKVEELFDEYWDGCFPINVEAFCDCLGVAIVPVDGLFEKFRAEAYVAVDFNTIYVDTSGYKSESARYRFSVAHELGHFVLHRDYYPSRLGNFDEWKVLSSNLDYVEYQANYFAASLLAPENMLINILNKEFGGSFARNCWMKRRGEFRHLLYNVQSYFGVSRQVLARRMRDLMPGAEFFEEIAVSLERRR